MKLQPLMINRNYKKAIIKTMKCKKIKIYVLFYFEGLFFLISVILISMFSNVNFNFFVCLEMRVAGSSRCAVGIEKGEEDSRTESSSVTGSGAGLDLDLF